jgi:hypothetical protein
MKPLILAILALALILPINPGKKNESPDLAQQNSANNGAPTVSLVNNQTCPQNTDPPNAEPPHWYASPEWWLCILGVPTLIFLGWQGRAAKIGAEAVMLSERAWLLLHGEKIGMPMFMADSTDSTRITVSCYVAFENCGKTPAEAILWVFELTIGDSPIKPPSLEIYTTNVTDKTSGQTPFPIGPGRLGYAVADSKLTGFISPADWDDYCAGKKFAWLCGVARYRDVFKRKTRFLGRRFEEHETRICLVYQKFTNALGGRWALGGPEGYNRAT